MEIYKGMRLRQVPENNGVDVEVLSEYNAYFCVPTTKTAYAIIERWCEENNVHIAEVISAIKIVHNGTLCPEYDVKEDETMYCKKCGLPTPMSAEVGEECCQHAIIADYECAYCGEMIRYDEHHHCIRKH